MKSSNRHLRVLLAKVGLDGHDRGIKIVAQALRDAGVEVVYLGIHNTAAEIARSLHRRGVLTKLRQEGFEPFMVCQTRVRNEDRREYTKHLIRLRHASQINGDELTEQFASRRAFYVFNELGQRRRRGSRAPRRLEPVGRLIDQPGVGRGDGHGRSGDPGVPDPEDPSLRRDRTPRSQDAGPGRLIGGTGATMAPGSGGSRGVRRLSVADRP